MLMKYLIAIFMVHLINKINANSNKDFNQIHAVNIYLKLFSFVYLPLYFHYI